jgi:hypothetical protein
MTGRQAAAIFVAIGLLGVLATVVALVVHGPRAGELSPLLPSAALFLAAVALRRTDDETRRRD